MCEYTCSTCKLAEYVDWDDIYHDAKEGLNRRNTGDPKINRTCLTYDDVKKCKVKQLIDPPGNQVCITNLYVNKSLKS
jgi:hypothetical protein